MEVPDFQRLQAIPWHLAHHNMDSAAFSREASQPAGHLTELVRANCHHAKLHRLSQLSLLGKAADRADNGATPQSRRLLVSESVVASDQIGHWFYIFRVTGETETPKMPCILNGCEHGEMVECIPRNVRAVNVIGIHK